MDNHSPLYNLFVKYLEGKCSPKEIRQLLLYFDDSEHEDVLESLIRAELGFNNSERTDERKINAAVTRVKSIIGHEIKARSNVNKNEKLKGKFNIQRWMKIAALWLVFITSGLLIVNYYINHRVTSPIFRVAVTQPMERRVIHLFDGTKVWLSPSSSLEYQDQLIGNFREVKLEGEAFFEVAKDKIHPFIIHSQRMDTRVVGTSFNIQSYKDQSKFSVTVVTGIVKVSGYNTSHKILKEVTLKPLEKSYLDIKNNTLTAVECPNAIQMLKRKEGVLTYDGMPVSEVIQDFSRFYNAKIVIESKSRGCLCYGEFNTTRPLNIVLEQLALAINAKVFAEGDKIILKGGCED